MTGEECLMSKQIPDSANLEWLRKAAKQLHKSWLAQGKTAKLADAQFFMAREYGFSSWRAMKADIEARQPNTVGIPAGKANDFLRHAGEGDIAAVRSMLDRMPAIVNVVADHPFWGGRPQALHVVIEANREDVFDLLLALGADCEGSNGGYDNWSPLMIAAFERRERMSAELRRNGAVVGLCEALLLGDDTGMERAIAQNPRSLERDTPTGSLLALARTPVAVARLLDLGVSPHPKNRWGADALEALSRLGAAGKPLVEALRAGGLSPSGADLARMGDHDALKELARDNPSRVRRDDVLIAAVDFGHVGIARWLLENGADVNARTGFGSQGTALHSAAWNGDQEMVRCLLEFGADPSRLDREHETTPAHWARVARTVTNNPSCDDVALMLADRA